VLIQRNSGRIGYWVSAGLIALRVRVDMQCPNWSVTQYWTWREVAVYGCICIFNCQYFPSSYSCPVFAEPNSQRWMCMLAPAAGFPVRYWREVCLPCRTCSVYL